MATTTASSQQPGLSFGPCRPLTEAHPTVVHHHHGRLQARLSGAPVSGTTTPGTTGDHHQPSCLKFSCPVRPDKGQLSNGRRLEGSHESNSGDQGNLSTRRPLMSPPPNNRIAIDYDSDSDSEDYDYLHGSDDDSDDGSDDEHFDDNEEDDDCVGGLEL